MKGKFLTQLFTDTPMTVVALVIFFVAFLSLTAFVFLRRNSREHYDAISRLPLSEGGSNE